MFDPLSLHKVCISDNEATIDYLHGFARNTCRCSLTHKLVRWSSPVIHKLMVEIQTSVEKGQQMGRAEAIQTGVV